MSAPNRPAGKEPPYLLLVTPKQFWQGWWQRDGFLASPRAFDKIRTNEDGNFVVVNPEWQRWAAGGNGVASPATRLSSTS